MLDLIKQLINKDGLDTEARHAPLIHRRMYLYNVMRRHGMIYENIGEYFNRDHATVMHGIKRYKYLMEVKDEVLLTDIEYYQTLFLHKDGTKKEYNLEEDVRKATTLGGLNIIKRRLENNLY